MSSCLGAVVHKPQQQTTEQVILHSGILLLNSFQCFFFNFICKNKPMNESPWTIIRFQSRNKRRINRKLMQMCWTCDIDTVNRRRSLIPLTLLCFPSFFHPSSPNLTAAKHESGSEKIYAHCVHPSSLCTSESKHGHESRSCHPPGLGSYLRALLPLKWHRAPREFIMVLLHWFQNVLDPLAGCAPPCPPHPRWFTKAVLYLQERHLERFISWHVAWRWIQSEVL